MVVSWFHRCPAQIQRVLFSYGSSQQWLPNSGLVKCFKIFHFN